jgi:hypothetical protein
MNLDARFIRCRRNEILLIDCYIDILSADVGRKNVAFKQGISPSPAKINPSLKRLNPNIGA